MTYYSEEARRRALEAANKYKRPDGAPGTFEFQPPGAMSPMPLNGQGFQSMPSFGMSPMGGAAPPGYGTTLRNMVAPPPAGLSGGPPQPAMALGPLGGGVGDRLKGVLGGVGGAVGGAVDWLTDEDQGYLRQLLLSNAIGTAGSIYEANKRGAIEDEDRKREAEERARRERVRTSYGSALRGVL